MTMAAGWMLFLLAINDHAVIYLQEKAFNDHYTAKKTGPEYIGLNQALKTHPQVKLLMAVM